MLVLPTHSNVCVANNDFDESNSDLKIIDTNFLFYGLICDLNNINVFYTYT